MTDPQRECTLDEWIQRLPESHRARKRYEAMARVAKAAHYNEGIAFGDLSALLDKLIEIDLSVAALDSTDGD